MQELRKMLIDRHHPLDIIDFIVKHYRHSLKKKYEDTFLESMLNPENLKPARYVSYCPTSLFYIKNVFNLGEGKLKVICDVIFDKDSVMSDVAHKNTFIKYPNHVHCKIIKQYRVTACGIYIKGKFSYNGVIYENQKITYYPSDIQELYFKFMNSIDYKQDYEFVLLENCDVCVIKHVEFIPLNKNIFQSKKQSKEINLMEKLLKYRSNYITDINVEGNIFENNR